jgi:hypothetical protein
VLATVALAVAVIMAVALILWAILR